MKRDSDSILRDRLADAREELAYAERELIRFQGKRERALKEIETLEALLAGAPPLRTTSHSPQPNTSSHSPPTHRIFTSEKRACPFCGSLNWTDTGHSFDCECGKTW